MRSKINPRTGPRRGPSWEAWYGARVRVKPVKGGGLGEFGGHKGTVIGIEGEYLRIKLDEPVYVKGVGMVRDDLWMPYTVTKLRSGNPRGRRALALRHHRKSNPTTLKSITKSKYFPWIVIGGAALAIYLLTKR